MFGETYFQVRIAAFSPKEEQDGSIISKQVKVERGSLGFDSAGSVRWKSRRPLHQGHMQTHGTHKIQVNL